MEKPILNSERIFVVDDNPNNLGVVAEYLKSAGYRVSVAPNGSVALERAAGIKPAVILLDVKNARHKRVRRLPAIEEKGRIQLISRSSS